MNVRELGFKIYDYMAEVFGPNRVNSPAAIDYKRSLVSNLFPIRTFVKGGLVSVKWYGDEAHTDLVISVAISYVRDSNAFVSSRTTERSWVRYNGEEVLLKTTKKLYTLDEGIQEGKRRRQNAVDFMKMPMIGRIMAIESLSQELAQIEGVGFMIKHKEGFDNFIETANMSITADIAEETNYPWLDALGSREFLIAELTY